MKQSITTKTKIRLTKEKENGQKFLPIESNTTTTRK